MGARVLSVRGREALERALAEGDGKDRDALGRRAEASEKEGREAVEGIRDEVEILRREHSRTAGLVERVIGLMSEALRVSS